MATTPAPVIPSADRAAAEFDKSAPAPSTPATPPATAPTPSTPAAPSTPAIPTTPAAPEVPGTVEVPDGLTDLLKDDLAPLTPETPQGADPLEALKDNPRVQELLQHETTVKNLLTKSEYIKEAAHIENAIADADVLWKIIEGKEHPKAIFEALKQTNPAAFQNVLAQIRQYVEQETGQPIAAAAAGQPTAALTPEQQRLAVVEKELTDRKNAETQAAFTKRVESTKTAVLTKINDSLKGTSFEGEGEYFLSLIGAKMAQKAGMQRATQDMVDAVEKNDFKLLEKTLREARNEEAVRIKARIDRMVAAKKSKAATIPTQVAGGAPPAPADPEAVQVEMDPEKRRAAMVAQLRG